MLEHQLLHLQLTQEMLQTRLRRTLAQSCLDFRKMDQTILFLHLLYSSKWKAQSISLSCKNEDQILLVLLNPFLSFNLGTVSRSSYFSPPSFSKFPGRCSKIAKLLILTLLAYKSVEASLFWLDLWESK